MTLPPIHGLLIATRFPCLLSIFSAGEAVPSTNAAAEALADLSLPADPFGNDELLEIVTIESSFANSTSSAKGKAKVEPDSLAHRSPVPPIRFLFFFFFFFFRGVPE